jgi:hypothetical protein
LPRKAFAAAVAVTALVAISVTVAVAASGAKPYAVSRNGSWETVPLLSVGDVVRETSNRSQRFQMVGIPDGLGAEPARDDDEVVLHMNHEFGQTAQTQPVIGGPVYRGSYVTRWILDEDGKVRSGERAYDSVFVGDTPAGPAAEVGNATPAFSRFCSGSMGTRALGFTRSIYFAGEESEGSATFSGQGGQAVAFYDNQAHVLPKLGKMAFENIVPQRRSDTRTVLMGLEDGPSTAPFSQLYMYVGTKSGSGSTLQRNGLDNGKLYALVVSGAASESASDVAGSSRAASWVEIASPETKTDAQLSAATVAAGAYGFARVEDGAFDKTNANRLYFVTTGQNATDNNLGRIYQLDLDPANPTGAATLKLVVDADKVIAGGGDTAVSPDNIDTSNGWLMVQEDGTTPSRLAMASRGRDGSIWRFPINAAGLVAAPDRVVTLSPPGRDGAAVGPGVWETSGIIDGAGIFGQGTWLFDVQAHSPTVPPDAASQGEDGQLLLLRPVRNRD